MQAFERAGVAYLRRFRARALATLVSRRHWYRAALLVSRLEALIEPALALKTSARGTAARLQSWIKDLSRLGAFPVPLRDRGLALVAEATANGSGVLFCSTHVPLNDMLLRVLASAGYPCLTVSHPDSLTGGRYPIPASQESVEAVVAGPTAFLGVRRVLRRGDSVFHLLDENVNAPLHDNAFRFVAKTRMPVLFWSVELAADGAIEVRIEKYPAPLCESEDAIRANVAFVESYRAAWRASIAKRSWSRRPVTPIEKAPLAAK